MKTIEDNLFEGCRSLESITFPDSVMRIGFSAFQNCSGLISVTFLGSKAEIGQDAFNGCISLSTIMLPDSISDIEYGAFYNCSNLTSIINSNSIKSIGAYAFYRCSRLSTIDVPNDVKSINGSVFEGCSGLISVTIGNQVKDICHDAFSGCINLSSIILPKSLTLIDKNAFKGCSSLDSITIPDSVTYIGNAAFYDCFNLESIKILASTPPSASDNTFSNYEKTLLVPESSLTLYKNRSPWNKFKTIMTFNEGGGGDETCLKPTISYKNGKLTFSSETEGATCQYTITDDDITSGSGNDVSLSVTYNISVYATKKGFNDSEVATATLCWIDVEPKTEGITNSVSNVSAKALLIKCDNGIITVEGADDGERINVYTPDGSQKGSAISQNRLATINTHLQPGDISIIKIGIRSVKVVMK